MVGGVLDLSGPLGGLLAGTWGAGAVMGYAFAHRTLGKRVSELKQDMKDDKADCDRRISAQEAKADRQINDLTVRLRELEDRQFYGSQRQLAQTHDSTIHLLDRGEITPVGSGT